MPAIDIAAALVRKWEGIELKAYPDPATGGAPWTIGVGHTGPEVRPGVVWTQKQAEDALRSDLRKFLLGVQHAVHVQATEAQLGAMASLAFNIGLGAFQNSTLLRKVNKSDFAGAADEFLRWNKAAGKVMNGLSNRRADERRVFLGDCP